MTSTLPKQTAQWIQKLAKACDGDVGHAKQQLKWLKEKVFQDNRGSISLNSEALSTNEKIQLEKYISERVDQNKPLQYILGNFKTKHIMILFMNMSFRNTAIL
jgi:hypothetical protein